MKVNIFIVIASLFLAVACGDKSSNATAEKPKNEKVANEKAPAKKAANKAKPSGDASDRKARAQKLRDAQDAYWADVKSGIGVSDEVLTGLKDLEKSRKAGLKTAKNQADRQKVNKDNRNEIRKLLGGKKYQEYIALTKKLKKAKRS